MPIRARRVTVLQAPAQVTASREQIFLRNLRRDVASERPCLVLDCSGVQQMDSAAVLLLLSCLEEVMKRNGDVKLASLPPGAEAMLRLVGANLLFEIYPTAADAVHSFERRSPIVAPREFFAEDLPNAAKNVA